MSVHILPPDEEAQNPVTTQITSEPTRALLLRYRLGYAKRGIRTSPADVTKKKPVLKGWQEKATTDPRRIHMESSRWPEAGILAPTGKVYGRWVLDADDLEDLARLEDELGARLRGISTEIVTPNGGLHIHFLCPEGGEEISGSVGKNVRDGFEGLDVRGRGNLALLPPNAGYGFANSLPTREAPPELVEWATNRKASRRRDTNGKSKPRIEVPPGEKVEKGGRHDFLVSEAAKRYDGDVDKLADELLELNERVCDPPIGSSGEDSIEDVIEIAEWFRDKEPCQQHGGQDPSRDELVEVLSRAWFGDPAKGVGGKTDSSIERVLLRHGARIGAVIPGVGLRVSISVRAVAEEAKCHPNTVVNYTKRARSAGRLRKDEATERGQSGAFVLLDPRLLCDTPTDSSPLEERIVGVSQRSHTSASELRTEHYRWRGLVGKGRERALCFLEAFGPMSAKELAQHLGWSRGGDVRRRYLEPLVELGLVEDRSGLYALAGDHRERAADLRREPYSTVQLRVRRVRSEEGLWVHQVAESGMVASEAERDDLDRDRHARQREAFRLRLVQGSPEADDRCRELLNAMDEEREQGPDGLISELERVEPEAPDFEGVDGSVLPFGNLGKLYPLVGTTVLTDEGPGTLWQVFGDRVGVVFDESPDEVTFLPPAAVLEGKVAA